MKYFSYILYILGLSNPFFTLIFVRVDFWTPNFKFVNPQNYSKIHKMHSERAPKAIPFIIAKNGSFEVTEDARSFLLGLDNRKVGVVCVVGKYRTGKSYFVNKVLLERNNEDQGFQVGPTVNPCTKGLWVWSETIKKKDKDGKEVELIVMDCEGFGGMDESENHDTRIFLFAILLSSYFIYNSLGSIDEKALQTLSLVVNLAKDIRTRLNGKDSPDEEEIALNFPSFLWVVRDFTLQMVDTTGAPITPKQYLESALALQKGLSDSVEQKNKIRRMLKHFFRDRDCITMVRPVELERDLQKLDNLPEKALRGQFLEQMNNARRKIFKKASPKVINGKEITGEMLFHIATSYTDAVNDGKMPNIEGAWKYVCKEQTEEAAKQALLIVEKTFNSDEIQNMVLEERDWKTCVKEKVMKFFKESSTMAEGTMSMERTQKLEHDISAKLSHLEKDMIHIQETKAKNWLNGQFRPVMDMINQDRITDSKDIDRIMEDIGERFEEEHMEIPEKKRDKIFKEFKQDKEAKMISHVMKYKEDFNRKQAQKKEGEIDSLRSEIDRIRQEAENEKNNLRERLQRSEEERFQIKSQLESTENKLEHFKEKFEFEQEKAGEKEKQLKGEIIEKTKKLEDDKLDLKEKLKAAELSITMLEQENIKSQTMLEQNEGLFKKQSEMLKQEITRLQDKIKNTEEQVKRAKEEAEHSQNNKQLDRLSSELDEARSKMRHQDTSVSELKMEKQYLESQIKFLKGQIEEGKKLHETLLSALQNQVTQEETASTNNLLSNNQSLMNSLAQAEAKSKILEDKVTKYKQYKKVVQSASGIQCKNCSKTIPTARILSHLQNCEKELPTYSTPAPTSSPLQLTISQTLIKEDPSTGKPYTEYLIDIKLNNSKWRISRKYKAFCTLHHQLTSRYPNLAFPSSASSILGFNSNVATLISSKRRTVIEDRRRALQDYLTDLIQLINIQTCPILGEFLGAKENSENIVDEDTTSRHSTSKYSPKSYYEPHGYNSNFGKSTGKVSPHKGRALSQYAGKYY